MKITIRRAIATLGLCALSTSPLMAGEYGYNQPTRLPAVNAGVHHAGYYSTSPYKTASADVDTLPSHSDASNIVIQGNQYGSSHAMPASSSAPCTSGCTGNGYATEAADGCSGYTVGGPGIFSGRFRGNNVLGLGGCGCSQWFASAAGLYFNRDDSNEVWLSYDDADIASRTLGTQDAQMDWSGGGEVTVGRYFNCGMNAASVTYWGIYSDTQSVSVFGADQVGNLDSSLDFNSVAYDDGGGNSAVNDWFDAAQVHRLRRDYEFHNVEVNLLGSACAIPLRSTPTGCCSSLQMSWVAGIRFFKFDEDLQYATDDTNDTFTGEIDEIYHDIDVENNLVGFQLGANGEYAFNNRWSVTSAVKCGIYGNYMENHQSIQGGTGIFATIDNAASPYDGLDYNFNGSKSRVSFLGEIDLGLRYQATYNWSFRGGYRALGVSGIALSTHQYPGNFNFEDALGAGDVDANGSLLLHGGYLGAEYNY